MLKQLPKQPLIFYLLIYFLAGILVLLIGPIYYPDSYAFLDMAINRSPVYSAFLKCFTSLFGDAFEIPVLISQYLIMVLATHFLLKTLYKSLKLHAYSVLFFQLVLLANTVIWYYSVNKILSESLAFPLVLVLVTLLFQTLIGNSFKALFKAILVLFFLQFLRGQFIIFIPIVILIAIYIIYYTKKITKGTLAIALLVLIPVLISFSERVYNKIVIDQYKNYAMTYVHFISAPFYIASSDDVSVFETEEEKAFFNRTFSQLEEQEITIEFGYESVAPYMFFERNFTKICNATVHQYNMDYYRDKGLNEFEQQYKVDELTTKMFLPLLKANFKSWVKHVRRSFTKGVGGKAIFLMLLLILACSSWLFVKSKDYRFAFLILAITLKFANNVVIAMVVHSIERYTYYFDWIIFAALILLFNPLIKKYSKFN
ncbi:hypothetical protein [Lacinutrix jangbogonensis]|uniref:hypothetical protein n=1 Tax=Lacinutrix jangbogonensis TaxID=1469557 RepID=UPI00053E2076|nr:hypothetical protein [Lacinutrix jangbogonensis]